MTTRSYNHLHLNDPKKLAYNTSRRIARKTGLAINQEKMEHFQHFLNFMMKLHASSETNFHSTSHKLAHPNFRLCGSEFLLLDSTDKIRKYMHNGIECINSADPKNYIEAFLTFRSDTRIVFIAAGSTDAFYDDVNQALLDKKADRIGLACGVERFRPRGGSRRFITFNSFPVSSRKVQQLRKLEEEFALRYCLDNGEQYYDFHNLARGKAAEQVYGTNVDPYTGNMESFKYDKLYNVVPERSFTENED